MIPPFALRVAKIFVGLYSTILITDNRDSWTYSTEHNVACLSESQWQPSTHEATGTWTNQACCTSILIHIETECFNNDSITKMHYRILIDNSKATAGRIQRCRPLIIKNCHVMHEEMNSEKIRYGNYYRQSCCTIKSLRFLKQRTSQCIRTNRTHTR